MKNARIQSRNAKIKKFCKKNTKKNAPAVKQIISAESEHRHLVPEGGGGDFFNCFRTFVASSDFLFTHGRPWPFDVAAPVRERKTSVLRNLKQK